MKRLYTEQQKQLAKQATAAAIADAKRAKWHRITATIGMILSGCVFLTFILLAGGCAGPN